MISQNGAIVPADSSSNMSWDGGGGGPTPPQFPAGLRVLVVDDDPICLRITEQMLKICHYEVTTCNRAIGALKILRGKKRVFDLVLSDLHMPDMDGFKLLEHVGLEMDLPVIMMSADDAKDVVMKGVTHGACDYLIKPVRMEAIKNIWQHVIRKKKKEGKDNSGSVDDGDKQKLDDVDNASSANEGKGRNLKRQKEDGDEIEEQVDSSRKKKSRVVWAVDLHRKFVAAVEQLGIDKAVPKKILELMNEPGLTREKIASHLQKYRMYLKKLSGNANPNRVGAADPYGYGHQDFANSGQRPLQSTAPLQLGSRRATNTGMDLSAAGQQGFFNSEVLHSPKMRPAALLAMNNKQMNMINGLSTYMEPRQMGELQGYLNLPSSLRTCSFSSGAVNGHRVSLTQQQSRGHLLTVGDHDFRQQMLSSEIPDHGLGISRTAISGDSSLQGSYINNSYGKISPAKYATNYPNSCSMNDQVGNSHALTNSSGTNNITQTGIIQGVTTAPGTLEAVDNAASMNGLKNVVPNYDIISKVHQYQSEDKDFKVQNVNLSFGSAQVVGAKTNNMEFGSSISTQCDGPGSNTCTVTEEVIIRRKIDQHKMGGASQHNRGASQHNRAIQVENSPRLKDCVPENNYQDLYGNINDELMDFAAFQQQDEHEFGL